jgi:small conductance mechanosensitive channel
VLLIGFVVALGALGLNVTPLVAAIGAAGLVIGLALQGTLSNFASGVLILIYRPFDVGDAVKVGGVSGTVEAMNLVQTTILTWDNQIQYVPNNEIWDSVITNINGRDIRRVDMVFGIGYGDDMAKAESIIGQVIEQHDLILAEPAPTIKVNELGDNSVNFVVRPWVKNADYWGVYWDLTRKIKEQFDAEGVGIPFPQRDIHLPRGTPRRRPQQLTRESLARHETTGIQSAPDPAASTITNVPRSMSLTTPGNASARPWATTYTPGFSTPAAKIASVRFCSASDRTIS